MILMMAVMMMILIHQPHQQTHLVHQLVVVLQIHQILPVAVAVHLHLVIHQKEKRAHLKSNEKKICWPIKVLLYLSVSKRNDRKHCNNNLI